MAKSKKSAKAASGRGSPEAVEKRRLARRLNSVLLGGGSAESKRDGRTEKRRLRLIEELKSDDGLKPLEVLMNVKELLEIGESIASIKKQGGKARKLGLDATKITAIEQAQATYKFPIEAWRFLGIKLEANGRVVTDAPVKAKRGGRKRKG